MLRREKVIRRRLERIQEEMSDIDGDVSNPVQHRLEAFEQALEWVLRERDQDEKPPAGSAWRYERTVTGNVLNETTISDISDVDEIALYGRVHGEWISLESADSAGEYMLLYQSLEIDDIEPNVDVELDLDQ